MEQKERRRPRTGPVGQLLAWSDACRDKERGKSSRRWMQDDTGLLAQKQASLVLGSVIDSDREATLASVAKNVVCNVKCIYVYTVLTARRGQCASSE
jgi:hypothetical protein